MIPSLLKLRSDQRNVLDLPFHGCHVVTGTPGAGKTVMAVYRAWALATVGRTVTLLTRSNLLYQYLKQMAPALTQTLDVTTYHRWLQQFWQRHFGTDPPKRDEEGWSYDWVEMHQNCILKKVRTATHLVVDEGQQLPVAFYQLCHIIGVGVTVFADHNEPIDDDQSTISELHQMLGAQTDPLVLRNNLRTTREIALLASEFSMEALEERFVPTRIGQPPRVTRVPTPEQFVLDVAEHFDRYPERSIGIICRSTRLQREVQSKFTELRLSKYVQAYVHDDQYRSTVDFSSRPVRVINAASMKGLEFDSVFVPDLDAYNEDPTSANARLRFFVLCTRARKDLCFAHLGPEEPAIVSTIPESLLVRHS